MLLSLALMCGALLTVGYATPGDIQGDYERVRRSTPNDAASQVELALWCEAHGLNTERTRHLAMAALGDPRNEMARALLGLVKDGDTWMRPEEVAQRVSEDADRARLLERYRERRAALRDTADAHSQLAAWCERQGLIDEQMAHLRAVVRLDPSRDATWRKLGCKKVHGRWQTEAELAAAQADSAAQREADKRYAILLSQARSDLREPSRREEAERVLARLSDPRAVPSILRVFLGGKSPDPIRGVQLLGQIDAAAASQALAAVAIGHDSAPARAQATQALRCRDPREFAGLLIERLSDPIHFEVRPVRGPGLPGILYVEGKQLDVRRIYAPPPIFSVSNGTATLMMGPNGLPALLNRAETRALQSSPVFPTNSAAERETLAMLTPFSGVRFETVDDRRSQSGDVILARAEQRTQAAIQEVLKTAQVAQMQLAADVAQLKLRNEQVGEINARVLAILTPFAGADLGTNRELWRSWYQDSLGYSYAPKPVPYQFRRTIDELVPLAYQPQPVPGLRLTQQGYTPSSSCFAAGTLVHVRDGMRPIESLKVGDVVLSQDVATGALSYRPVVASYHNPPAETLRIQAGDAMIVATTIHRFWRAGKGWALARDLQPGDTLRTFRGVATVTTIEPGETVPVYNLDIDLTGTFFVGDSGWLVRDHSLPDLRTRPFDALSEPRENGGLGALADSVR